MNTKTVQSGQAHEAAFRSRVHEKLVSRVLFQDVDGQVHQTSIYSTLPLAFDVADAGEVARHTELFSELYKKQGLRLIRMEFINQFGLEL